jgi:hypothetical protein
MRRVVRSTVVSSLAAATIAVASVLALGAAPPAGRAIHSQTPAPASSCEITGVARIVAIGDVHGAIEPFVQSLKLGGLVDNALHWTGGATHLVQTGDLLDRGPDSRKALDLIRALGPEAAAAGGAVHMLLGNHEEMRMIGDFRYTSPGEFAAFATPESAAVRQQVIDATPPADRARLLGGAPLGLIEMVRAFGPTGPYGAYLRTLPAVLRINDIVFVHGGLSPAQAARPCGDINEEIRRDLTENLARTRASLDTSLASRDDGPLWYRGLAEGPESAGPDVEAMLKAQHARALVVGHTPEPDTRIDMRFHGGVFVIDTGMNQAYIPDGRPSALEITAGTFTAMYADRRVVLKHD